MNRQVEKLQSLLEVSRVISSSLRLDRVLAAVIHHGMQALEAEAGTIWLLERDREMIIPMVALGPKGEEIKQMWLRPGEGIAGTVLEKKKSFLVENVRKVPQWAARFDSNSGFNTRSILCVPLVFRDHSIGVLQFVNKRNGQLFGKDDLTLALALASQAAVAIENSRAFEDQIVKAHEEERRRIARDIHDGPAQNLASLLFRVDIARKYLQKDPGLADAELDDLKKHLQDSLKEVRGIIFDLRPQSLAEHGLPAALQAYLDGMAGRTGLSSVLTVGGTVRRLPPALEITIYRLVQEAVNNARKHARATTVTVTLEFRTKKVTVMVEDDGVGFDVEAARRRGGDHYGLTGMKERVDLMEGTFDISSRPGRGTRLAFSFPLTGRGRDASSGRGTPLPKKKAQAS